ncbi:hypothetical protein BP6252_01170 [Coleophoma cylindrospora]|uniref:Dihydroorotate dehydrogenase (quinone), mitochondrial n=1 Tax=Coleophoma cylindrospora TaxID=1849047 RepID=A0A3D8STN6_9HELO|nr:hypothetical protein BP6252_01170 [Coleophoma cylindrospora]
MAIPTMLQSARLASGSISRSIGSRTGGQACSISSRYSLTSRLNATTGPCSASQKFGLQPKARKFHTSRQNGYGQRSQQHQHVLQAGLSTDLLFGASVVLALSFGYLYVTDARSSIHQWFTVPVIRFLVPDAEEAHHLGTKALKEMYRLGIHPRERSKDDESGDLRINLFGHVLSNPIGISGGLDKNADIPDPLFSLGPAVVEVGGITPLPQEGNPKPRVFRVPSQNAIINRYGLNSKGADHVAKTLRQRVREYALAHGLGADETAEEIVLNGEAGVPPGSLIPGKLLAVQIAKNKVTPEQDFAAVTRDYVYCVERLARYADILVVNVSSPNTPGLRSLQAVEPLTNILSSVVTTARAIDRKSKPPVMVKVSPDENSDEQVAGICKAVIDSKVDGVIVGNTTTKRPAPLPAGYTLSAAESKTLGEMGGYSGPQLFNNTVALVKKYRYMLDAAAKEAGIADQKVIFASGGIATGEQAKEALDAGASVAMVYTAMTYGGVGTISHIKTGLRESIKASSKK